MLHRLLAFSLFPTSKPCHPQVSVKRDRQHDTVNLSVQDIGREGIEPSHIALSERRLNHLATYRSYVNVG